MNEIRCWIIGEPPRSSKQLGRLGGRIRALGWIREIGRPGDRPDAPGQADQPSNHGGIGRKLMTVERGDGQSSAKLTYSRLLKTTF
jgi:hypothetical protein